MFLNLPDPDPLADIRIRILLSSAKIVRKNIDSICLWLLYDCLSLKNDVKTLKNFFWLTSQQVLYPHPNPDWLVRGMDPRIRIRTKNHGSATLVCEGAEGEVQEDTACRQGDGQSQEVSRLSSQRRLQEMLRFPFNCLFPFYSELTKLQGGKLIVGDHSVSNPDQIGSRTFTVLTSRIRIQNKC